MADGAFRSLLAFWLGGTGVAITTAPAASGVDYYQTSLFKNKPLIKIGSSFYLYGNSLSFYKFPLFLGRKKMPFVDSIKTSDRHAEGAGDSIIQNMEYDASNNLIYLGATKNPGGPEDQPVWFIYKYTYDGSNRLTKTQVKENVVWADRAVLGWL